MRRFAWSIRARRDLEAIQAYWLPSRADFVSELMREVRRAIPFLLQTPGAGSPLGSGSIRKWRLGRTPYLLFYRYTRQELRIVRVRHEHENWPSA